ncbi:MAG: GrpB family protein [Patescibacteria group bacterium]|jgi:GrpB-like predicted nucleotidyltransferase (UPF0157 family)|nr:GrpB family protein [Patescibacteria group bacterium]
MLSEKQKKWIDHLPDDDEINIFPFDKESQKYFQEVKEKIQSSLNNDIKVEQRGSTSLGAAGQNEIDIYVPLPPNDFYEKTLIPEFIKIFGPPKSIHQTRIRFQIIENEKKLDIFLIDKESDEWMNGVRFEEYLKKHEEALREYEKLKYACNGYSTRKYYEKKVEFINKILDLVP